MEDVVMNVIDFAPFTRSSIGFDRLLDLIANAPHYETADTYPPYNIAKTSEDHYRITLAVAGFDQSELSITWQPNQLVVAGRRAQNGTGEYLYQGIAGRAFQRQFNLADHVRVTGANLKNGLLSIELAREVPEAAKPRRIEIAASTDAAQTLTASQPLAVAA
jgi:molecular chaperone IbpA